MKTIFTTLTLSVCLLLSKSALSCNVTPSFSRNTSHTCGLPVIVKATNTSTGSYKQKAKYWWKVNNIRYTDTIVGLDSLTILLKQLGTNNVKLFVKDSAGCIDSSAAASISVSSGAKTVIDQNATYSLNPSWINCIQYITDPDTFSIRFSSADTLKNLKIFWGDGSSDLSSGNLPPNTTKSHLYTVLGVYTVKIVTRNGACTDTVYGTVTSQRQPTAGIIGPPAGSNRGCVPHRLRIVNNSYNISNTTIFDIDWGVGPILTLPYTAFNDTLYNTYRTGMCNGVIKITARNGCGNSVSTWNPIDISDRDDALWTVATTCDPVKPHTFYNASSDKYCLIPDVKEYFWDFGDGTTFGWTTSKAPQTHYFNPEGDYTITLIAKNSCGYDTFADKVRVYYNPRAGFKFNANRGCKPLTVSLTDTSKGRGNARLWTVTEAGVSKTYTDSIFSYTFTKPGVHTVSIRVTNPCGSSTVSRNFTVNDKPTAKFANIGSNCVPVIANFVNTSTSYFANPTYTWDFGDGTTSNLKNPLFKIYTVAANYTVRLIVSDSCGSDTFKQTFTAFGLPQAILNGDTTGCTFDSLSFNNQSVNSNSFDWYFGDGQSANYTQTGIKKHVYTTPGSFTIRLISAAGTGCKDTIYHNLVIKPGAKAMFNIDKPYACAPATFSFINLSVYGKDFRWYANGNLISSLSNLSDSLLSADSTVVKLKLVVTSNSSCQDDSLERIYFTPKNPKAVVPGRDSGCGILKVNFINSSTYSYNSVWNLGNGTVSTLKNPVAYYISALKSDTFYYPELKVANWAGCADSVKTVVKVFPGPTAAFSSDVSKGCGPLAVNFTNTSVTNNNDPFSSLIHQWNFSNGSFSNTANPSATFVADSRKDTFYKITLKTTTMNGCFDSITKTIQVYPLPSVSFIADKYEGCAMLPVNFTNLSHPNDTGTISIMTFQWSSGNGSAGTTKNFSAVYGASKYSDTIYNVKLLGFSEHGCKDSSGLDITVHPQPVAKFAVNNASGCTPLHVSTINQSWSNDGGPLSHAWRFGDSYNSTSVNDSTVYLNSSNLDVSYMIWYEATSQYGCRDTAEQNIIVRPKPIAKFNVSTKKACAPLNLKVTDASINASTYFWGQGDNLNSGQSSETMKLAGLQVYDTTYTIGHYVVSPYGCVSDTVYQYVLVLGRPVADFEFLRDSFCARDFAYISNNSLGGYKYLWRFGDNTTSSFINPKHKFPLNANTGKDSIFKVTLEASSYAGCNDTAARSVFLVNRPLEKIVLDKLFGCTDLTLTMQQKSTKFKTLYWDFGDNTQFETGDSVAHTYNNQLNNVTMQPKITLYRERFNCLDTSRTVAYVYPKPVAGFKAARNNPCDAGIFTFTNQSKYNISNEWWLENGATYTSANLSQTFAASTFRDTSYNVKLFVKNSYQCIDSVVQTIMVKQKQVIKFITGPVIGCENSKVDFTNQSAGSVRSFWTFGDGGISTEMNPSYIYNRYGNYNVILYGYDKDGCMDSSRGSTFVKVLERPKADFTYLPSVPILPNATVTFTATPIMNTGNQTNLVYEWNFGDNSYPTKNMNERNPTHVYSNAGYLQVKLSVWNQGCGDFVMKPMSVEQPKPEAKFTPDTVEGCVPLTVKFSNQSTNVTSYRWIFGDGSPDSYEKEPTHVFEFPGMWDITLFATGPGGTTNKTYKYLINVHPKPVVDFYTVKRFMNLPNAVFYLQNISDDIVRSEWTVYDSINNRITTSTQRDPNFSIPEMGRYGIRLIGTNYFGCKDTMDKEDYLNVMGNSYVYTPNAFSPNNNGKNESFKPSLYNINATNYGFRIYNRWGEKLFETTDRDAEWDGTFKGVPCEQETYVWTLYGEYANGDLFTFRGTVTLLR